MTKDVTLRFTFGKVPRSIPWLVGLSLLATAPLALVAGVDAPGGSLVVAPGDTRTLRAPANLGAIDVAGTLLLDLPAGAALHALSVHVGAGGAIRGLSGANGADSRGADATGAPGTDGRDVVLTTSSLVVDEGGIVAAGDGGRGGSADGYGIVAGGHGGRGGSVRLDAIASDVRGAILAGSGGAGGNAVQILDGSIRVGPDARAVGGDGGDTGVARLNGVPIPASPQGERASTTMSPDIYTVAWWPLPTYWQCGTDTNDVGQGNPVNTYVGVPGAPNLPIILTAGDGGAACMISIQPNGTTPATGSCNAGNPDAVHAEAKAVGGKGGDGTLIGAGGGDGGRAWAGAKAGNGGGGQSPCNSGSAAGGGAPGQDATAEAKGGEGGAGGDSPLWVIGGIGGNGGNGGDAYSDAEAGAGGNGGTNTGVGAGGAGGAGGVATSTATGGAAGKAGQVGATGGNGGLANAYGKGGSGGTGGNGGTTGATGGDAGSLSHVNAYGGAAGAGKFPGLGGPSFASIDPEGGNAGQPGDQPGGRGGDWIIISIGGAGGESLEGQPAGSGGAGTINVPNGTGKGGVGGDFNPDNNRGDGHALLTIAQDGPDGCVGCNTAVPGCTDCTTTSTPTSPLICGDVGYAGNSNGVHVYWTSNGIVTFAQDLCPASGTAFSGELGFAVGGTWLFSRAAAGPNGGSGTTACYGSPADAHHGLDSTIHVQDDVFGGAIGFTVTSDYNRTTGNTGFTGQGANAGPGNTDDANHAACGDNLVEPCPAGTDDSAASPPTPDLAGGCNNLDASFTVFPADGLCSGWGDDNLGNIDPTDPAFPGRVLGFALQTIAIAPDPSCIRPAENTWNTVTDGGLAAGAVLGDLGGADGSVVLFLFSNVRIDANHFGTGTTGTIWTS